MAIQTIYDTGENYKVHSKYDGALYAIATSDCICGGVGDEFELHWSSDSLSAYFNEGSEAIIGGSFFKITGLHTLSGNEQLPSNSTFYLCATIDLTQENGRRGTFSYIPNLNNLRTGNLNGNGTVRDLVLYQITTGSSGVITVIDKRVTRTDSSTSVSGITLKIMSESDYESLSTKDPNTLYFIPEN